MAKKKTIGDPRNLIIKALDGRSIQWLSKQSGESYHTLRAVLTRKTRNLTPRLLKIINETLHTNFELPEKACEKNIQKN